MVSPQTVHLIDIIHHAHILACVSGGDAKGASESMSKLIDDAERDIRAAYGPPASP